MNKEKAPLSVCMLCARGCGVNRQLGQLGFCHASATPKVALVKVHPWEEPPISGTRGSGTVFFSHCNLRCAFCQNHVISAQGIGKEISIPRLAEIFLELQGQGVHNINLVSPTHFIDGIVSAIILAKANGLTLPIVYNSNGYDSLEGLALLDGLIDIYLPDFKYWDDTLGETYSQVSDYRDAAIKSILEMRRQAKKDVFDEDGIMKKGLLLRHLILPNHHRDSMRILDWVKDNLGEETWVSLMCQYTPMYGAKNIPALSRKLTTFEYEKVTEYFLSLGLRNGFTQKRSSASSIFTPSFDLTGVEDSL